MWAALVYVCTAVDPSAQPLEMWQKSQCLCGEVKLSVKKSRMRIQIEPFPTEALVSKH